MANVTLRAVPRAGKANWARRNDQIPAVVYGRGVTSESLAVASKDLHKVLERGANQLIQLVFDGFDQTVMVKEIQRHPVRGNILHVDFHAVDLDRPIRAHVPLHTTGEESVAGRGGIVQHQLREVEIESLPAAMPSHLEVRLSALNIGDHISAGELTVPEGVRLVTDPAEIIVTVVAPRLSEEAAEEEEEAEAAEEPERPAGETPPTVPEQPPK